MRKQIIVNFQPFDLNQQVYVYDKGECIVNTQVETFRLPDVVNGLRKRYGVNQIELVGSVDYLDKFKQKLMSTEYDCSDCEINITNH